MAEKNRAWELERQRKAVEAERRKPERIAALRALGHSEEYARKWGNSEIRP